MLIDLSQTPSYRCAISPLRTWLRRDGRESDPKPVIRRLAEQFEVRHEALRNWIRQDEADRSERDDRPMTSESEEWHYNEHRTHRSLVGVDGGPTRATPRSNSGRVPGQGPLWSSKQNWTSPGSWPSSAA
ncbi:transposase [Lentzea terrae]|uniref:transposase n=1 Tax=Lentzea terrae TaxID=2200761 RepID=UPI0038CC15CA